MSTSVSEASADEATASVADDSDVEGESSEVIEVSEDDVPTRKGKEPAKAVVVESGEEDEVEDLLRPHR